MIRPKPFYLVARLLETLANDTASQIAVEGKGRLRPELIASERREHEKRERRGKRWQLEGGAQAPKSASAFGSSFHGRIIDTHFISGVALV